MLLRGTFRRPGVFLSTQRVKCGSKGIRPTWQYNYLQFEILATQRFLRYLRVSRKEHVACSLSFDSLLRGLPLEESGHVGYIDLCKHCVFFGVGSERKEIVVGVVYFYLLRLNGGAHFLVLDIILFYYLYLANGGVMIQKYSSGGIQKKGIKGVSFLMILVHCKVFLDYCVVYKVRQGGMTR